MTYRIQTHELCTKIHHKHTYIHQMDNGYESTVTNVFAVVTFVKSLRLLESELR
jgi:hypothetical protein